MLPNIEPRKEHHFSSTILLVWLGEFSSIFSMGPSVRTPIERSSTDHFFEWSENSKYGIGSYLEYKVLIGKWRFRGKTLKLSQDSLKKPSPTFCGFSMQLRRLDFFFLGGGQPDHLKAITRAPQGVRGRRPQDGSEVSFFQTMQSIRKWIEFSKIATFFLPKKFIFSKKNSKNWTYLTGIYNFFRIIIWKFSYFMKPINPEKISVNSLIWLRNLQWRREEFFQGNAPAT